MRNHKKITEKFYQFLAHMFSKDDMDELEAQERLYFIQYIRAVVSRCMDMKDIGQIPILELTMWATLDGKTNITVDPNPNSQIIEGWSLSELTKRLMDAIDDWDVEDIGQKEGKVVDMMSALGWVKDKPGTAG